MTARAIDEDLLAAVRRVLRRIGDGLVPPRDGMRALIDVVVGRDVLHQHSDGILGDALGLEVLVGAYYQYSDIDENPDRGWGPGDLRGDDARAYLDRQIISEAVEWVHRHDQH